MRQSGASSGVLLAMRGSPKAKGRSLPKRHRAQSPPLDPQPPTAPLAQNPRAKAAKDTKSRLDRIAHWPALALQADWSAAKLARLVGVSPRTLQRYFLRRWGKRPQSWLLEQRMARASQMLLDGWLVKQTAAQLGYRSPEHFARVFQQHYGHSPSVHAHLGRTTTDGGGSSAQP